MSKFLRSQFLEDLIIMRDAYAHRTAEDALGLLTIEQAVTYATGLLDDPEELARLVDETASPSAPLRDHRSQS
jgi:hypothetical protein